jgi:hypothetical protein
MVNPVITDNTLPSLLLAGEHSFHQETFSAAGALTFPKGMVLGRITASGKVTFYASGAVDGTQFPMGVLMNELITTGAGDTEIRIMLTGQVREDKLLVWTAGVPVVPTTGERQLLHDYGIIGLPDDELLRFDNS